MRPVFMDSYIVLVFIVECAACDVRQFIYYYDIVAVVRQSASKRGSGKPRANY